MFGQFASALALVAASPGLSSEGDGSACYDAEVIARIVNQTPSVFPEPEDGSIVLRWPWFVDLEVLRVRSGHVKRGIVAALSVQHTYYSRWRRPQRWLLRRNEQGSFNLLGLAKELELKRCAEGTPPVRAFLSSSEPGGMEKLRREAEARYGRRP